MMPMPPPPLTDTEKAYFNTVLDKAPAQALYLTRMMLDGKPVAVIGTDVYNRFTKKREGMMPLAILISDHDAGRLRGYDGSSSALVSPHDLDPDL